MCKWTPKREQFCREYLIDFCATDAAIRAGFSAKSAKVQAWDLMQMPEIQERIKELQNDLAKRTEITQDRVLAEYAKIAFSDMRHFAAWDANGVTLMPSCLLSEDDAVCVAEVSQTVTKDGGSIKFKLHDKKGALDSICKMLGFNAPDKNECTGKDGGPIMFVAIGDSKRDD
jgi:phage terminase small subunit